MLLAVDTSTAQVGLALYDGSQVIAEMTWQSHQHHTVELAPAFIELLRRAEVRVSELQVLGVALGPGSFTSLRVGLAFVKGLALTRKLPVIGIPSLDILAAVQPIAKIPLAVFLQAGRARIALGWYKARGNQWKAEGAVRIATVDSLVDSIDTPTLVAGELQPEERQRLTVRKKETVRLAAPSMCLRRPAVLAELAWARWRAGKVDEVASLAPIYLHTAESIPA
ncbi:MAG TPA: tRNA (adenosine(37)-N6)-threonylcarbamoyltransferase complex dimerization subunit type 1 TsaB [Anaerolineales bacterium]|nr:tRNA (adenosine(37)-N6)-threonylcarbamoyltransferase complex dimerization subunit type 1 TsaB [Anaerolineales bacterium]